MSTVRRLIESQRRYGLGAALISIADRLVYRPLNVAVVNIGWLDIGDVRLPPVAQDPDFTFRFLDSGEVRHFARNPSNELSEEFADRLAGGLDFCFAALSDGDLAAYSWYALGSVEAKHAFGVALSYPSHVVYMYKGFTHPNYRGARLHGALKGLALQQLGAYGVSKLISMIHWTNAASMKSCRRIGYSFLGRMWVSQFGSHRIVMVPGSAESVGVRFEGRHSSGHGHGESGRGRNRVLSPAGSLFT
jgi:hypothetical protein